MTGALDDETPVLEVMIPANAMSTIDLKAGETAATVKLHDLLTKMETGGFHRIPILGVSGEALYVVHDSVINQFAS